MRAIKTPAVKTSPPAVRHRRGGEVPGGGSDAASAAACALVPLAGSLGARWRHNLYCWRCFSRVGCNRRTGRTCEPATLRLAHFPQGGSLGQGADTHCA